MRTIYLAVCLLFLSFLSAMSAPFTFRGLTGSDGLSDLTVCALYKDSCGYMWMGTSTSVERFDGIHLKHYPIPGENEKLKWVNTIVETSDNRIWMGNDMGLWQVDGDSLRRVAPDVIAHGVRSICQGDDGTLYIGSETGLYICRDGAFEFRQVDSNILSSGNFVISLYLDKAGGSLWMITRNGLYAMNLKNGKTTHYPNSLFKEESECSYRTMTCLDSVLYIGTMNHGILRFDMKTAAFSRYVDVGCDVIMSLSDDGNDMLYVGTDGNGVHFVSVRERRIVRSFRNDPERKEEPGLRSNSVYSLLVDRDSLVWVGLYQTGVDYTVHQEPLFAVYKTPYFTSEHIPVRSIYIGFEKKLIGSRNGLYCIDEQKQSVVRFGTPSLRSNIILTCYAFLGKVYIGTYGGGMYVFELDSGKILDFDADGSEAFRHNSVFCFSSDEEGRLWIGASTGVYCYKGNSLLHHFDHKNSPLPEGNVYVVFFDSMRKGWICTETGIAIWDPASKTIKKNVFPEHFPDKAKVGSMFEDSEHKLYFVPYKGNLFVSDLAMSKVYEIGPDTPLEGKEIRFVTEDKDSCLWIGTGSGLFYYDKKNSFVPYNFVSGIPDPNFLPCEPVRGKDGRIWFANNEGLLYLPENWKRQRRGLPYTMHVTEVYVNGKSVPFPVKGGAGTYGKVILDPEQNNVTFRFSGFAFTDPAYAAYEYKLEGLENDWKRLVGKSEAVYYNLEPGAYVFKVRRMGEPDTETGMAVKVLSPTNWKAWTIGIVLCCIAMVCSFFVYVGRKRKERKKLEAPKEKYRTSNLSDSECRQLVRKLENAMSEKKLYANPDLKLMDLAEIIGVSSHTLSYLFNQYLKKSYYDYVNDWRIEEFKELIARKAHAKYTLNTLIEKCGFGSRASFFRCFKNKTGITPNEYIKQSNQ